MAARTRTAARARIAAEVTAEAAQARPAAPASATPISADLPETDREQLPLPLAERWTLIHPPARTGPRAGHVRARD
jgi:hypothetical protein